MNPEQVKLVKSSFGSLLPTADEAGRLFYERLFALDPALRPLFKGDMAEQSRSLMRMIAVAVNGLDRLETIVPAVSRRSACGMPVTAWRTRIMTPSAKRFYGR
jgi:hemoglobin-like flavoprotein